MKRSFCSSIQVLGHVRVWALKWRQTTHNWNTGGAGHDWFFIRIGKNGSLIGSLPCNTNDYSPCKKNAINTVRLRKTYRPASEVHLPLGILWRMSSYRLCLFCALVIQLNRTCQLVLPPLVSSSFAIYRSKLSEAIVTTGTIILKSMQTCITGVQSDALIWKEKKRKRD